MYETKQKPLATRRRFLLRLLTHSGVAAAVLSVSLLLGMVGYVYFERLTWIDAFLNAAMLLGGMGPVNAPMSFAGKLFAGIYALYAGLIFLVTVGLVFTPIVHRVLHRFHIEDKS